MDEYFNKMRAIFPLSCDADVFIGRKAITVFFGEETAAVKTWKQVFTVILIRCNQERHEDLMYLRGKTSGKVRLFLSEKPDGMRNPVKLDSIISALLFCGQLTYSQKPHNIFILNHKPC